MESHGLKYKHVIKHKADLERVLPEFEKAPAKGEQNLQPFAPLIRWGVAFSTAAEMQLKKENLRSEIEAAEDQLAESRLTIDRIKSVTDDINEMNMAAYYAEQKAKLIDRKMVIDKIVLTDQEQAVDYQKKLHGFEKIYFEKLLEAAKANA